MSFVLHIVALIGAFALGWIVNPAQRKLDAIRGYVETL